MSKLLITIGDPAGIGPEIILKALAHHSSSEQAQWTVCSDPWILAHWAKALQVPLPQCQYIPLGSAAVDLADPKACAMLALRSLESASEALNAGRARAVVTAPISKTRMYAVGFTYPGHTEFFADKNGTTDVRMMFIGETLRIVLDSIHIPLKDVAAQVSQNHLHQTLEITCRTLETQFGIATPKIAVCGLNPHAGEDGNLGLEEQEIIIPLLSQWPCVSGPFASDAYFGQHHYRHYDATVCLYHDQGLIPFKMLHAHDGVNFTAGLPYIRTSPDHGPAFDIAGKNLANPGSFLAAMQWARHLCMRQKR